MLDCISLDGEYEKYAKVESEHRLDMFLRYTGPHGYFITTSALVGAHACIHISNCIVASRDVVHDAFLNICIETPRHDIFKISY